jgi:hypothetical protein
MDSCNYPKFLIPSSSRALYINKYFK